MTPQQTSDTRGLPGSSTPVEREPMRRHAAAADHVPPLRQLGALARAEMTLLLRNRMQLVTAAVIPLFAPLVLLPMQRSGLLDGDGIARQTGTFILMLLLFVVFYNLLSAYVARRDDLVLKRLRAGAAPDAVVLAGTAIPAIVIALAQTVLLVVVSTLVLDITLPVNWPLLVLGVLAACPAFALLALLTVPMTRTVEAAQVTCLPVLSLLLLTSGTLIPLEAMPGIVQDLARFTPSAAVAELTQLGWLGQLGGETFGMAAAWGQALLPLLVLLGWSLLGILAVRRWFRWEPRG